MSNVSQDGAQQTGRTISLSEQARLTLEIITSELAEMDVPLFASDTEAIRFACLLGLRVNGDTLVQMEHDTNAKTIINIGSLETDGAVSFTRLISLLAPNAVQQEPLTRVVRRYAEWGLSQIHGWHEQVAEDEGAQMDLAYLIEKSEALIAEEADARTQED